MTCPAETVERAITSILATWQTNNREISDGAVIVALTHIIKRLLDCYPPINRAKVKDVVIKFLDTNDIEQIVPNDNTKH